MGLQDTLKGVAVTALSAVGDLAKDVKFKEFIETTYDPSTGEPVTIFYVYVDVKAVKSDFSQRLIDGDNIKPTDQLFLIPANYLPAGITPKAQDQIVINSDQSVWQVINNRTDPAEALWELQCREIEGRE